jgi:hypothetical protein
MSIENMLLRFSCTCFWSKCNKEEFFQILRKVKMAMVAHTLNSSTLEAEERGFGV